MKKEPRSGREWSALAASVVATYDVVGEAYDRQRGRHLFEKVWLDRFLDALPGRAVLDLGCGAGEPVAQYLMQQGAEVSGLDASRTLLDMARERFPVRNWHLGDMRDFNLGCRFGGVIAWNSFFHLDEPGQIAALGCISKHLCPDGVFLTTVGPSAGTVTGTVGGQTVYHMSLSIDDYRWHLANVGMEIKRFVPEDPECVGHSVLLAQKSL